VPVQPEAQKSQETQGGLLVIDSNSVSGAVQVRHGVTTDPTSIATREWSILSQQDVMAYRMRASFENNSIIGAVIDDGTLSMVKSAADAALQSLVEDGSILAYDNLAVRQSTTNLDVVQVAYSWRASVPLNYVDVQFTLDVSTGDTVTI
jgi:hypothetical protein